MKNTFQMKTVPTLYAFGRESKVRRSLAADLIRHNRRNLSRRSTGEYYYEGNRFLYVPLLPSTIGKRMIASIISISNANGA